MALEIVKSSMSAAAREGCAAVKFLGGNTMPNQYTGPRPRPVIHVIGPSIAYITLSRGMIACVEVEDVPELSKYSWHFNGFYAARRTSRHDGPQTTVHMHSHLLPCPKGFIPDHENRSKLDNRRHNLRPANNILNRYNANPGKHNQLGIRGVRKTESGRYSSCIKINGKTKHLGTFGTCDEASYAFENELALQIEIQRNTGGHDG